MKQEIIGLDEPNAGASMNDHESEEVLRCVEDFLGGQAGHGLDVGKREHFERLLSCVRQAVGSDLDDDNLRLVTAMCWLGPRSGIPPELQRKELLQIMREIEPDPDVRSQRTMEFVIAYGCGKWRSAETGRGDWQERWPGAVQGLQRALEPALKEADRWLRVRARVVGYPQRSQDDLAGDAWMLALRLIHAQKPLHLICEELSLVFTDDGGHLEAPGYSDWVPTGAKSVFAVEENPGHLNLPEAPEPGLDVGSRVIVVARDDEMRIQVISKDSGSRSRLKLWEGASITGPTILMFWTCSCGHLHCAQRHRLEAWDPARVSLWSFVASAVKGPQPSIQLGSFVAGMYFPLLAKEGFGMRLRLGDVEYKVCRPCSRFNAMGTDGRGSSGHERPHLTAGDYVVHDRYGTGILVGEMSLSSDPNREYLCIQYAEGDKLYVPAESTDITRYDRADLPKEATLGSAATLEYEGNSCPRQGHPFDPGRSHRVTHERLILVGDYAPHFLQRTRIRCKNRRGHYRVLTGQTAQGDLTERWENLYQPSTSSTVKCPLCGEKPAKTRLSTVWERTFAVVEPLDSNERTKEETETDSFGQLEGRPELMTCATETEEGVIHERQGFDG